MGVLATVRQRLSRVADSWRRMAEQSRLDAERKAFQASGTGPLAFLTTNSKGALEFYLNRGWEVVSFRPRRDVNLADGVSYPEPDEWHLKIDRQLLAARWRPTDEPD